MFVLIRTTIVTDVLAFVAFVYNKKRKCKCSLSNCGALHACVLQCTMEVEPTPLSSLHINGCSVHSVHRLDAVATMVASGVVELSFFVSVIVHIQN